MLVALDDGTGDFVVSNPGCHSDESLLRDCYYSLKEHSIPLSPTLLQWSLWTELMTMKMTSVE